MRVPEGSPWNVPEFELRAVHARIVEIRTTLLVAEALERLSALEPRETPWKLSDTDFFFDGRPMPCFLSEEAGSCYLFDCGYDDFGGKTLREEVEWYRKLKG